MRAERIRARVKSMVAVVVGDRAIDDVLGVVAFD